MEVKRLHAGTTKKWCIRPGKRNKSQEEEEEKEEEEEVNVPSSIDSEMSQSDSDLLLYLIECAQSEIVLGPTSFPLPSWQSPRYLE